MPITTVAFCRYPAETDWAWRQADWAANRFISALKGKEFRGYAYVPVRGQRLRLSMNTAPLAKGWFADLVYEHLNQHAELEPPFFFVPIPDSGCTAVNGVAPRMLTIAKDLAARFGDGSRAYDVLRWLQEMQPSHQGGERNVRQLYGNLTVTGRLPNGPVVLLDDITTAGGHIRAAETRIHERNGEVELAITAGRTAWEPADPVWGTLEDEFAFYRP